LQTSRARLYIRPMTRVITTEGVDNLRDFGGYETGCGRGLKARRLYRSAHHQNATDEDLALLAALNLAVIVDLRRAEERARFPSRRHDGFSGQVIQNDLGDADKGWEAMLRGQTPTAAFFRERSLEWYRRAPFEARHIDLFARYFAALTEAQGPVLIHCAAGKDRTGLLAALTHYLAGVSREDMIEDYLLTNTLDFHGKRSRNIAGLITEYTGVAPDDAALRAAMGVEACDLEAAFEVIEAEYGSVDNYLDKVLGVDARRRDDFEARYLG
jgi:protein tyrosine/serine phosphatase